MVDEASYAERSQRSSGLLAPSPPRTPKPGPPESCFYVQDRQFAA